ncbi:LPS export ABC transporter periplasmic protein LptC [Dyella sp.]|uniref:LPS export ABC transporter periplasmic protein LptC n=1 Tax=Dyella sp. TaxID=1869338 RepID=UPI002ED18137
MRLPGVLRDRGTPVLIVLLAVGIASVQGVYWWLAPAPKVSDFIGPPRSGYTLHNFRVWSYDDTGAPGFTMTAPRLDRREGDESLYIISPKYDLPSNQAGVPDWQGDSNYAVVNKEGTLLKLQGAVNMHRPAFDDAPAADLKTSEVTAWPKENRMETAESAQLTQGESRMTGVGMRANLNDNHLELLNDVHGTFVPRSRNRQVQPAGAGAGGPAASAGKKG